MSDASKPAYRFWIAALGIFSALATIQIIFLTVQNRHLKMAAVATASEAVGLKSGDKISGFKATAAATGQDYSVSYDDSDHLLFILSTTCPWCEKNIANWKNLADKSKGKPLRIVGISVDPATESRAYAERHHLNFEVVTASPEIVSDYKIASFPQTILVRRGGGIEKVWQGLLSEKAVDEISRAAMGDCAGTPCVASATH
jgi:peroxiredoxin